MKQILLILVVVIIAILVYHFVLKDDRSVNKFVLQSTTTKIEKILNDPRSYEGKTVIVAGTVEKSFSFVVKFYSINDGTGTLYIRTDKAVPLEGELIKVKGTFSQFIKIGTKQYSTVTETNE